ncbi:MAG TPA: ATP-binding protein [Candidatus Binatia bacterium]|nr:ATP-binding protein [Candidatus Binatia bacterium]
MRWWQAPRVRKLAGYGLAVAAPAALTALLLPFPESAWRDYVYLYLGVVASLGLVSGLGAAFVCAGLSFLLVDYFFVPPAHTLTIADEADLVNLVVFVAVAAALGGLGSRRRRAQLEAERMTDRLRTANTELERLRREQEEAANVAVRLARAEQQVRALETTDRLRTDLIANVSHELRTPLASILTGISDLLEGQQLPPAAHHDIEALVEEARRLERLVADLLDLARIEGHVLTLTPVEIDLEEAIDAAVSRLRLASPDRCVEVRMAAAGLEVLADWDRLGQIMDNLLQNADRHAPPETAITVTASPGKRSMVVVRVIDRGPGVAADDRERIFERFVRGSTDGPELSAGTQGRPVGTGLGLAIVRGLVEAHAGRIWVEEPEDGEGARFAFTLPAAV